MLIGRRVGRSIAVSMLGALLLVACAPGVGQQTGGETPTAVLPVPTQTTVAGAGTATPGLPGEGDTMGKATVESVELMTLESFPVQIRAIVRGYLSDACTIIGEIKQEREGNTFKVTLATKRPPDAICAQVITPFEETVALDVVGLKAGTYTVDANGVTKSFTLSQDNMLP